VNIHGNLVYCTSCGRRYISEELPSHICGDLKDIVDITLDGGPLLIEKPDGNRVLIGQDIRGKAVIIKIEAADHSA
jgi:hypothetical protein